MAPRVGEAMERSVRWLDRCIAQHEKSGKKKSQNLFAIVQGGLSPELRNRCLDEMIKRKDSVTGFAIGGLSGGEDKGKFAVYLGLVSLPCIHRRLLANVSIVHPHSTAFSDSFHNQNQTVCGQTTRRPYVVLVSVIPA